MIGKNGDLYVADYLNARVQRFASDGTYKSQWPTTWNGGVRCVETFVDRAGNVYATNLNTNIAKEFDPNGVELVSFVLPDPTDWTSGILVDAAGHVYVTGLSSNRIYRFASTGELQYSWKTGIAPETAAVTMDISYCKNRVQVDSGCCTRSGLRERRQCKEKRRHSK